MLVSEHLDISALEVGIPQGAVGSWSCGLIGVWVGYWCGQPAVRFRLSSAWAGFMQKDLILYVVECELLKATE